MTSTFAGISHFAFRYVLNNVLSLIVVSLVPFAVSVMFSAVHVHSYAENFLELMVVHNDVDKVIGLAGQKWQDFIFMGAAAFFGSWLMAKVIRLVLSEEPASLIGSGGTLRSAFWLFLYSAAAFVMLMVPLFVASVAVPLLLVLLLGKVFGGILGLVITVIAVAAFFWALCRLWIGFQPVALGERPSLFLGWRLTRWESWGLFFRVLAAALGLLGVAIFITNVFGDGFLATMNTLSTGYAEGSGPVSADQVPVLARTVILYQIGLGAASLPVQWYFLALFAEAYRRLSKGYTL